jgi:fructokinase
MSSSVFCIGELLIDFFCTDVDIDLTDGLHFQKQAGGAPANVCAAVVKLGGEALFCGKVGQDPFGQYLRKTMEDLKVDTSLIVFDEYHPTTLAFVSLNTDGERDFTFNRGADAYLTEEEIDRNKLNNSGILHFGSATALLTDPFQSTYLNIMEYARRAGKFISFDPNFRKDLWSDNLPVFVELAQKGAALADFVKVSHEELQIISGKADLAAGTAYLHRLGAKMVAVTLGKEGTFISNGVYSEVVPSIPVNSIDSTGAGDAFVGATLFQFAQKEDLRHISVDFDNLKEVIAFSNKVGALVCTKVGAITAIPNTEEVHQAEADSMHVHK